MDDHVRRASTSELTNTAFFAFAHADVQPSTMHTFQSHTEPAPNHSAKTAEQRTSDSQSQTTSPPPSPPPTPSTTPPGPYRAPTSLWYTAHIKPHGSLFSIPAELWLEVIQHLDIRSTEHFLSALFFLLRPLGICPPIHGPVIPHLLAWLGHGGALYEIMTKYPPHIAEDIFSQSNAQEKINVVLALYQVDKR